MLLPPALGIAFVAACSSDPATGAAASGTGGAVSTAAMSATSTATSSVAASSGSGGSLPLPDKFAVIGVVTHGISPVEGATVMQGGGKPAFTTGPDGAFSIDLTNAIPGIPGVVAAKLGYRTAGAEFLELPDGPITPVLRFAAQPDNIGYAFGEPGNGDKAHDKSTKFCGHCHTTFSKQFQTSAHAKATRDPLVQDLYAGVAAAITTQGACVAAGGAWRTGLVPGAPLTSASKCYVGNGVLPDLNPACGGAGKLTCDDSALATGSKPKSFGRRADCHAPGIDGIAGAASTMPRVVRSRTAIIATFATTSATSISRSSECMAPRVCPVERRAPHRGARVRWIHVGALVPEY